MLSSNWHVTLRLTVFEIFAVKWQKSVSTQVHFLTQHLVTAKDIAIKKGEARSGAQLYRHANFHADRRHRRRDIPGHTNK